MITDYGLEVQKTADPRPSFNSGSKLTLGFNYLAVGTGSTLPNASQTALANEVARTVNNGGFSESENFIVDTATQNLIARSNLVRVINFTSNYNLTEFGFFVSSSGANCVYRQLFREDPNDPSSNPVVISVQSGDQLRISYSVVWTMLYGLHITKSVIINGEQNSIKVGINRINSSIGVSYFLDLTHPRYINNSGTPWIALYNTRDVSTDVPYATAANSFTSVTGTTKTVTFGPTGTYTVENRVTYGTSGANGTFKSVGIAYTASGNVPFIMIFFVFDTPITKTDLQTLTLSYTITWSRA